MRTVTLVAAAGAVGAGVLAGSSHGELSLAFTAATAWTLALAAVSRRSVPIVTASVLLCAGLAGAASAAWRSAADGERLLPVLAERGDVAAACGSVTGRGPRSALVDVRSVEGSERAWRTREPLRVAGGGASRLGVGEEVCAAGELRPAKRGRDAVPLLVADDIERKGSSASVRTAAAALRERFSVAARTSLPDRQAGLLLGMTDGDVRLLDDATMEAFRITGLAHLVAVSGSNVAVVLAIVALAVRTLVPARRWLRAMLSVPPLIFFAFLTGLEPSVLRAVVTAGVVLAVAAPGRTAEGLRAAAVAFILLVLASPELLTRPGFQLSFAATLGLLLWSAPLVERLLRRWPLGSSAPAQAFATALATTLAAQIAVAPLLALHFGQIPALGGIANLIVAPLAPVVMIGGALTLGLATAWPALGWAPATLRLVLDAILAVGTVFSRIPGASVGVDLLAAGGLTLGFAAVLGRRGPLRAWAVVAAVVAASATAGGAVARGPTGCRVGITALDVGQGTAVVLRDREHSVLVDGGPASGGVVDDLRAIGVRRLDAVFASHPHADHVEGIEQVVARIPTAVVVGPSILHWGVGRGVVEASRGAGVAVDHAARGRTFTFSPGLEVEVLSPEPGPVPEEEDEDIVNAQSLVLLGRVGGVRVLLPGDIAAREQEELVGPAVRADVLVAPHHGSADIDPAFVEAVDPRATLVTVGADNRFGHPTSTALRAYALQGGVLRTDRQGTVAVCVGDGALEVTTER